MRRIVLTTLVLAGLVVTSLTSATAARSTDFADWGPITGTSNDFRTTMSLPAVGFPAAAVASDSRSDVALPTGATNWFGENTPPGQVYGSSRDQTYLNLRPRADNASSPSTTTYTFERPTPQGWAFVLGDIDADQVQVSATRADGSPATTAELGFRSTFNLCATTPRPSSVCASNGRPQDVPTWDPVSATLRGNAAAVDSDGATGWFEPTTSLRTLTFTFTRRGGFPVFQTWFAVAKQDVSGSVTVASGACDLSDATLSLVDPAGAVVATRPVGTDGTYAFGGVAASDGYRVALSGIPDTCIATSPSSRPIDLTSGDASADFTVREAVPVPITGTVSSDGDPLEGVVVTLTPVAGGPERTATTDVTGRYVFEDNADDASYTISVDPPTGYLPTDPLTATVPDGAATPVTDQDFVLQALPTVSGAVSGPDGPLAGVVVELTDGVETFRAVTQPDGSYALPRVPAGAYTLSVPDPPPGYEPAAGVSVTVGSTDLPNQDIVLERVAPTGSVSGTVLLDGAPAAGVQVTIRPSTGSPIATTTDREGTYGVGDLLPGTYEIVVAAPDGSTGTSTRTVVITPAGEDVSGQDFAFTSEGAVTPPPDDPAPDDPPPDDPGTDDTAPGGGGAAPDDTAALPDTGAPSSAFPLAGAALVAAGGALVVAARPRRVTRGTSS